MSTALARTNLTRTFRVKPLLRSLGLAVTAHWPDVSRVLKKRLTEARLAGNDELAAQWSAVKAFLKRNVTTECSRCKRVMQAGGRTCKQCLPTNQYSHG